MSWLRKYFRPTWARIWATIAGIAVFVSILGGVGDASDRLESAVESVSPIVAALIPLGALFGAVFLCGLLAWMGCVCVVDRRNKGPARRKFTCLHDALAETRQKLEDSITGRRSGEHLVEFQGRMEEAEALVESLAYELKHLGIETPPVGNLHNSDKGDKWLRTLPRLESFSGRGDLDAAIRLGESLQSDSETDAGP